MSDQNSLSRNIKKKPEGKKQMAASGFGRDTALGRLGMSKVENGNSKRTSALRGPTAKNANWLPRFFTTATLKPCRSLSASLDTQERKVSLGRHLVLIKRSQLRQGSSLQRQPIPHAELPCNLYRRHNQI